VLQATWPKRETGYKQGALSAAAETQSAKRSPDNEIPKSNQGKNWIRSGLHHAPGDSVREGTSPSRAQRLPPRLTPRRPESRVSPQPSPWPPRAPRPSQLRNRRRTFNIICTPALVSNHATYSPSRRRPRSKSGFRPRRGTCTPEPGQGSPSQPHRRPHTVPSRCSTYLMPNWV